MEPRRDRDRPAASEERGRARARGFDGHDARVRDVVRLAVVVGALGVVFGDIGTSPIYTLQTVFKPGDPHPVPVDTTNVYGVASLVSGP